MGNPVYVVTYEVIPYSVNENNSVDEHRTATFTDKTLAYFFTNMLLREGDIYKNVKLTIKV